MGKRLVVLALIVGVSVGWFLEPPLTEWARVRFVIYAAHGFFITVFVGAFILSKMYPNEFKVSSEGNKADSGSSIPNNGSNVDINPASGLPTYNGIDTAGNPYGTNSDL